MTVSKPSAWTFGSRAAWASGSPWTRKTRRGKPASPDRLPLPKWPSQSSSSDSSAWAEKPLIERIWQRTWWGCPSSLTVFSPAWRWAPSVPTPLVADEQQHRPRVADEVAQVADDPAPGEHPVRGDDHVRPRRPGDRLRRLEVVDDHLVGVVER